jgi:DNA-binding NtrC family response regulator
MAKRILVVDDDAQVLKFLVAALNGAGYETAAFKRFEDARAHLAACRPDLLLTDIRLGEFNGLQLALLLRDKYPDVPAFVLTGYEDPTLRSEAASLGVEYLMKPLGKADLLRSVAGAFSPLDGASPAE